MFGDTQVQRVPSKLRLWLLWLISFPLMIFGVIGGFCAAIAIMIAMEDEVYEPARLLIYGIAGLVASAITLPLAFRLERRTERDILKYHEAVVAGKITKVHQPVESGSYSYKVSAEATGTNLAGSTITQTVRVPLDRIGTVRVNDPYPWTN